jgi:hypothetical protein
MRLSLALAASCMARPSCLRLLADCIRAAASRTFWTAGSKRPIRTAMIAITTSSSISVKARRSCRRIARTVDDSMESLLLEWVGGTKVGEERILAAQGLSRAGSSATAAGGRGCLTESDIVSAAAWAKASPRVEIAWAIPWAWD